MTKKLFILFVFTIILSCKPESKIEPGRFQLSLAEWSLHKTLFSGKMNNLQFAAKAREMGFDGIEYVNTFFKDKAENTAYLDSLNALAKAANVKQVLIMIDGEGGLAHPDSMKRDTAINNHKKWVRAAKYLGCHSIRVNAYGEGSEEEVGAAAVKGLGALADYAAQHGINIIVENHGGYSSKGYWLADVMRKINKPNCGTLPDFGNFCIKWKDDYSNCLEQYDRYKGMEELLPFAKGVSAKSNVFDEKGDEKNIDYYRMMDIVNKSAYRGFIGVEYEGEDEEKGIMSTKTLLEKIMKMK